jgi:hypothetical protein
MKVCHGSETSDDDGAAKAGKLGVVVVELVAQAE